MSNKYRFRRGPLVDVFLKKTGTIAIEIGDMLKLANTAGRVKSATVSGDSTSLVGIAMSASPTTDPTATQIRVALIGHGSVFEFAAAASDAYTYGDCFKITAKQQLTQKTVVNLNQTATNVVAICAEDLAASGSNVLVQFLPGRYQRTISST